MTANQQVNKSAGQQVRRSRLAWFTPVPPVRSGIAAYNAELLPLLAETYEIDVFVDQPESRTPSPESLNSPQSWSLSGLRIASAHDFVWQHFLHPYDLIVYQVGNETCHDYMWPYVVRYPGLVVLHDGVLHHSRAAYLLQRGRHDDYRAEFRYNHPDVKPEVAQIGIMRLLGSMQFFWPMRRVVMESATAVAVHSEWLASELGEECPHVPVGTIRMGVADPAADPATSRERMCVRHGIPADALIFAAFGRVTPEKRIRQVLGAAASARGVPKLHLLLVGELADYYDVAADVRQYDLMDRMTITGFVRDEDLPAYLAAVDVCLCLRWPSSRETSASWLRCLAAGKPTVITDLAHSVDVPALDPRSWTPYGPAARPDRSAPAHDSVPSPQSSSLVAGVAGGPRTSTAGVESRAPVCVAVDILDEGPSLQLAMERLGLDADLCARLGAEGKLFWQRHHTLAHMADDYRRIIDAVRAEQPRPITAREGRGPSQASLPRHLRADCSDGARALLRSVGVSVDFLEE